jgi:hypothetical protein
MHIALSLLLIGCCVGCAGAFVTPPSFSLSILPSGRISGCQDRILQAGMNFGGRPPGKSTGVEAKKRKVEEDLNPEVKKHREDNEKQARRDFFKRPVLAPTQDLAAAPTPVLAGPQDLALLSVAKAATATAIVYPHAPKFKDRVAGTIYSLNGQKVKWDGKRDFLCACDDNSGCKGGLKVLRCEALRAARPAVVDALSLASSLASSSSVTRVGVSKGPTPTMPTNTLLPRETLLLDAVTVIPACQSPRHCEIVVMSKGRWTTDLARRVTLLKTRCILRRA